MSEKTQALREPEILSQDIIRIDSPEFADDHVALVTGAASGIGRALAIALAVNGVQVVAMDIAERGLQQTVARAAEMGAKVVPVMADLQSVRDMETTVSAAARLGRIRFLANVAGMQHVDPIEEFPLEVYDRMQHVMVRAPFYLSRLCIPHMRAGVGGGGVIANMCSVHAHIATKNKVAYNVAKFALRGLTQSIAAEGDGRIRSFSVSVGYVSTPLALGQVPDQARQRNITPEEVVTDVMLGRSRVKELMRPVEVANLFVFGFSHHGRHLVGGDLLFDGGMVLTY